jgi:hypothetical protein
VQPIVCSNAYPMLSLGAFGLALGQFMLEGFELRVQAYEGGSVAILPIS